MRKPKRPRSVPREEIQRIIDFAEGDITWDDVIETAPGRFRPNPASVARIEARFRSLNIKRSDIQDRVDDLTHQVMVLEDEVQEQYAHVWVPGTLLTTWTPPDQ